MSTRTGKVGSNDPCPCGSGRKHKRCCQGAASAASNESAPEAGLSGGRFRFKPGSYGGPGGFAASISCLKQVRPGEWDYHFVLANPAFTFEDEQSASDAAKRHLNEASEAKMRAGSDLAFAAHLKSLGYLSVDGFKVIEGDG